MLLNQVVCGVVTSVGGAAAPCDLLGHHFSNQLWDVMVPCGRRRHRR